MTDNIEEIVKQHQDSFEKIRRYFGEPAIFSIEDWTEKYWDITSAKDLRFDDEDVDEFEYSEDIFRRIVKEKYTLCHVRDCFGEKYWVLLDNNKRRGGR